jgi:hypothetical protein
MSSPNKIQVRLNFGMRINESHGQSFKTVGLTYEIRALHAESCMFVVQEEMQRNCLF